jgi:hypothetical protein
MCGSWNFQATACRLRERKDLNVFFLFLAFIFVGIWSKEGLGTRDGCLLVRGFASLLTPATLSLRFGCWGKAGERSEPGP